MGIRLLLLASLFLSVALSASETDAMKLILSGSYSKVKKGATAKDKAAWAFAQFHLRPGTEAAQAAQDAHKARLPLGTFVLLLCHRNGVGVRRNESTMHRLNFELRKLLEKKKEPTPLEEYILSQLMEGDADGIVRVDDPDQSMAEKRRLRTLRWDRLLGSAKRGFAQSMNEVGEAYQSGDDAAKAYQWYERAAKSGLAAGLKNQGFFLSQGRGCNKDPVRGLEVTKQAAEGRDVYAAINMAVFFDRGIGCEANKTEARKWIECAVKTGSYEGYFEKGLSLLEGNYGYTVDRKKGLILLQRAADTGSSAALYRLANWYARGIGLTKNGKKAVAFAEAAFVQGEEKAARILAHIYSEGLGEVKPDAEREKYWQGRSNASLAYVVGLDDKDHPMVKYLKTVDPFTLRVE